MKVIKRDGRITNFDEKKIFDAINAANKTLEKEKRITEQQIMDVVSWIMKKIPKAKEEISVEEIQDLVEDGLVHKNHTEVVRNYIKYRDERQKERFKKLEILKEIKEKLDASNVQNQNANVDEASFGGRKGEADSALLKQLALDYYISPKFAKNHTGNRVYIHDLDSYVIGCHNCLSVPVDELLANGFKTRQVFIRPAGSLSTAMQLVAVLFQLQSLQQFGGVAATHLDWSMVPYVRKSFFKLYKKHAERILGHEIDYSFANYLSIDDGDYKAYCPKAYEWALEDVKKEAYQSAEGMLHNLNSLQSRSGNQLPFSSINYGTCTLPEGRIITEAILNATIDGVGNGETSIFPCQIFQMMDGVNTKKGEPNYDLFQLAIKCTSKRLYPNYVNCDWSNDQDCCDVEYKEKYLNSLSEEQRNNIIKAIEENPSIGKKLGLYIEEE